MIQPMTTRALQTLTLLCFISWVTGCEKSSDHQPLAASQPTSGVITGVNASQAKTQRQTAAEILAAFHKDISVCTSVVKVFETDRSFIDEFLSAEKRNSRPLGDFLRQASFASAVEVQYILSNLKYFFIDVDMEGNAMAVAWVDNEGIFCTPSFLRLQEIEALGESSEAWEIRVNFLDRELKNLIPTDSVLGDSEEQFKYFKANVEEAFRMYSSTQRHKFIAWVKKAIAHIELQRNNLSTDAGLSLEELNKRIDEKIGSLRSLAGEPHTERLNSIQGAGSPSAR
jgi:hypothetical protein